MCVFEGVKCSVCGATVRYRSSRNCVACTKRRAGEWRKANYEASLAAQRRCRQANSARANESNRKWRAKYPEKYAKLNRAHSKARKAVRRKATPSWADMAGIVAFYKACPSGKVVDHVIPLRGKTVCGLHLLQNLQYLGATENLKKGNKHA